MMKSELISIIIPVYNVEDYLARCLESILFQSFKDFEVLLIDDGSTDGSGKICDAYAQNDTRIRVIHKVNGGVSSARNVGLNNANGQYISFVDSDDFVHPCFLEFLYNSIKSSKADISICDYEKRNDNTIIKHGINELTTEIREISHYDFSIYSISNHSTVVTKLYRFDVLKNHFFDTSLNYGEDAVYNFSLVYSIKNLKMVKINISLVKKINNIY